MPENEDLVFTLETVVEKFEDHIAPHAMAVCQHLANAFWRMQVRLRHPSNLGVCYGSGPGCCVNPGSVQPQIWLRRSCSGTCFTTFLQAPIRRRLSNTKPLSHSLSLLRMARTLADTWPSVSTSRTRQSLLPHVKICDADKRPHVIGGVFVSLSLL